MSTALRVASPSDVPAVCALMAVVAAACPDRALFVPDDAETVARHITEEGFTVLAVDDLEVVGFCIVRVPGDAPDNLAAAAGLPPGRVAHVESVAVHPAHRGAGLQRVMVAEAERVLAGRGLWWATCTVAPGNTASLRSFDRLGYRVVVTVPKYGGLLRHVLVKELPAAA